jgi:hypothetical protein
MHPSFRCLLFSASAIAAIQPAAAQTTVLRNDDLSSGSHWLKYSSSGVTLANNALSVTAGSHAVTYFTQTGTFQTLGYNETLQVTFELNFTQTVNSSGGFRVGIFKSDPSRPTGEESQNQAQGTGPSNGYRWFDGYAFTSNIKPGEGSNALRLSDRTPKADASDRLLSSTASGTYNLVGTTGGPSSQNFAINTPYQATYSISRGSGDALTFAFGVTGGNLIDFSNSFSLVPSTYTFDTFAIYSVTNTSNFTLDNFRVTHAAGNSTPSSSSGSGFSAFDLGGPAIPEPSTYAACAGAAVLGLAFWRRRRAAAKALAA